MRSTDFNTPPLKLILMALIVVVGLHVLTAVALMKVKTTTPTVEPIQSSSPIEIQLLTLPPVQVANSKPESPRSSETIKEDSQAKSEPAPVEDSKQKENLQPIEESNQEEPEQVAASKKVESAEPIEELTQVQDSEQVEDINQVQDSKPDENLDSASETNTNTVERAATTVTTVTTVIKKSDSDAGSGSKVTESSPVYDNTYTSHSTNPSTPNTMVTGVLGKNNGGESRRGRAKPPTIESTKQTSKDTNAVKKAAELAAQKDFNQEGRETAEPNVAEQVEDSTSKTPINFSGHDAAWIDPPSFKNISDKPLLLTIRFKVTEKGTIKNIEVNITNSKINISKKKKVIENVKRRLQMSKIKPFIVSGVPVVGIVTLTVEVKP